LNAGILKKNIKAGIAAAKPSFLQNKI